MQKYEGYVGAPYNFIGISPKVYDKKEIYPHHRIDKERKSGRIRYEIETKTPLCCDDGTAEHRFYRDARGQMAIPGSTVRGLVRSNVQILSCSSVLEDIENGYLMYRNVAGGIYRKKYNDTLGNQQIQLSLPGGKRGQLSVLKNVKAGYMRKYNGKYEILPTVIDDLGKDFGAMNYYVLSERKIIENGCEGFEYLKRRFQNRADSTFRKTEDRNGRTHYKGNMNKNYRPYFLPVAYRLKGVRTVLEVADPEKKKGDGRYLFGYVLSSGTMQEKKAFYVIPEADRGKSPIPVPDRDIDDFRRDYEGRKNQVEAMDKTFFQLPQEGELKPVFYITLGKKLYFGFTPRLRLFYENDIYAGLPDEQKKFVIDYNKLLFGYTGDDSSYKSRLSFLDAHLEKEEKPNGKENQEYSVILGGPKPTSYLDYLESEKGGAVSYNDEFRLRGIKQYWLHKEVIPCEPGKNEKVVSVLHPCRAGAKFEGEIRFTNLTDEELGMLLWGLLLEEKSEQNLGKGKPYGFGRIKVSLLGLDFLDKESLYSGEKLCLLPYGPDVSKAGRENADPYIQKVKAEMKHFLGCEAEKYPPIHDFLLMKQADKIPSDERTRYMKLAEYQPRIKNSIQLPCVGDVIEGRDIISYGRNSGGSYRSGQRNGGGQGNREGLSYSGQRNGGDQTGNRGGGKKGTWDSGKQSGRNKKEGEKSATTSMGDLLKKSGFSLD